MELICRMSLQLEQFVTEEDLHKVFDSYGSVLDVSIKESSVDKVRITQLQLAPLVYDFLFAQRTNRQSGYGFVHFSCDRVGVECAFRAVSAIDNATVNGVTYYVELSKNLLKQFNDLQNDKAGGGDGMGGQSHGVGFGTAAGRQFEQPHSAYAPQIQPPYHGQQLQQPFQNYPQHFAPGHQQQFQGHHQQQQQFHSSFAEQQQPYFGGGAVPMPSGAYAGPGLGYSLPDHLRQGLQGPAAFQPAGGFGQLNPAPFLPQGAPYPQQYAQQSYGGGGMFPAAPQQQQQQQHFHSQNGYPAAPYMQQQHQPQQNFNFYQQQHQPPQQQHQQQQQQQSRYGAQQQPSFAPPGGHSAAGNQLPTSAHAYTSGAAFSGSAQSVSSVAYCDVQEQGGARNAAEEQATAAALESRRNHQRGGSHGSHGSGDLNPLQQLSGSPLRQHGSPASSTPQQVLSQAGSPAMSNMHHHMQQHLAPLLVAGSPSSASMLSVGSLHGRTHSSSSMTSTHSFATGTTLDTPMSADTQHSAARGSFDFQDSRGNSFTFDAQQQQRDFAGGSGLNTARSTLSTSSQAQTSTGGLTSRTQSFTLQMPPTTAHHGKQQHSPFSSDPQVPQMDLSVGGRNAVQLSSDSGESSEEDRDDSDTCSASGFGQKNAALQPSSRMGQVRPPLPSPSNSAFGKNSSIAMQFGGAGPPGHRRAFSAGGSSGLGADNLADGSRRRQHGVPELDALLFEGLNLGGLGEGAAPQSRRSAGVSFGSYLDLASDSTDAAASAATTALLLSPPITPRDYAAMMLGDLLLASPRNAPVA